MQPIYDIAELCFRKGIEHVILCPGSRSAPLTLAFVRHGSFQIKTISDERSAGFIGLGIAQQTKDPCILVCTSGTAVFNFAPAIAEAFFNEVPLLVITADRPQEWIAQHDGQTIFQTGIYGKHVKASYQLPLHYQHPDDQWEINKIVNEAVNQTRTGKKGPVHINIPFREPFYPKGDISYSQDVRVIDEVSHHNLLDTPIAQRIIEEWSHYNNVLMVSGQSDFDQEFMDALENFSRQNPIPVIGDIISNLHGHEKVIRLADSFLGQASADVKKSLRPDLLITFGKSVISKNLKLFIREYSPKAHWHIQSEGTAADTFLHLSRIIRINPIDFIKLVSYQPEESFHRQKQHNYFKLWEIEERRMVRALDSFFPQQELGEFELLQDILKNLPQPCNLHLANSLSVRYANYIGLKPNPAIQVFSNRGTSGIDGCTSTAVGHCLTSQVPNVLITGDMAFFYDRNAFWHNYPISNLRVVVLNNQGGGIFKMIDGPGELPECDEYFVTRQSLKAKSICEEFGFEYLYLDNRRKLKNLIQDFFEESNSAKILEIQTEVSLSKTILKNFKTHIKNSYDI